MLRQGPPTPSQVVTLWGSPSPRLRTHSVYPTRKKRLGFRLEEWISECCRTWYDVSRCQIWCVRSTLSYFFFLFVTSLLLGEVYYLLYADDYEMSWKVAFNPKEPSLGRIRADSVSSPHSLAWCISRVERNPALAWHTDLFADTSCNTPLKEGRPHHNPPHWWGLNPKERMAIFQRCPTPDGLYVIKNWAANIIYWATRGLSSITTTVYFCVDQRINLFRSGASQMILSGKISTIKKIGLSWCIQLLKPTKSRGLAVWLWLQARPRQKSSAFVALRSVSSIDGGLKLKVSFLDCFFCFCFCFCFQA